MIATGAVSSLTGVANTAGTAGYADGLPTAATFRLPEAIIVVGSGVYVTDRGNDAVRKIQ